MKIIKPGFFIRIAAFLTRKKIVCLTDDEGNIKFSLAYKTPFDIIRCPVYWFTGVGNCILLDDGRVAGHSSYIKKWKYV